MKKAKAAVRSRAKKPLARRKKYPIAYWSHSSLTSYLRNPLFWYKRYVLKIYDMPRTPSSVVGSAGHLALEQFYLDVPKEEAIQAGLAYLRNVPDFELNFGAAKTKKAQRAQRASMERDYLQAINFYLARPPRHKVLGAEVSGIAKVEGLPLPVKAISDLVVVSKGNPHAVDIVDHKFVQSFTKAGPHKPLFLLQSIFNYYTIRSMYERPVKRFIVYECKKSKNADGKPQLRKHVIEYDQATEAFELFHRLVNDATQQMKNTRIFLPNPSDMFDGEHSFDVYRLRLLETEKEED